MNKFFRFIENVSLAIIANSIYSLAHSPIIDKNDGYILLASLYTMLVAIFLQEN
jgi:hypothetical protein